MNKEAAIAKLSPYKQLVHTVAEAITTNNSTLMPEAFLDKSDLSEGRGQLAAIAQSVGPLCVPPRSFVAVIKEGGALIAQAHGTQTPPL